jgi:transposase
VTTFSTPLRSASRRSHGQLRSQRPVDRARPGSKQHLLTDGNGIPLAVTLTGGNRNDVPRLIPLLDAVPPVRGKPGRPRRRPDGVIADRGYDHDKYRRLVMQRGIWPSIARRGIAHIHTGLLQLAACLICWRHGVRSAVAVVGRGRLPAGELVGDEVLDGLAS